MLGGYRNEFQKAGSGGSYLPPAEPGRAGICAAQEITVAAAADLQFVMQDIGARFQSETGKSVKLIYGSSGNFAQQLQNGAPFDMFFSANLDYPKQLETAGLTEPGTIYRYAIGKIVIWVANNSKLDVSSGLKALLIPPSRRSRSQTRNMHPMEKLR